MILTHVPEPFRSQTLAKISHQKGIRFPAAYFIKAPYAQSPLWQNLTCMDETGLVIKTAPDFLFNKLVEYLDKNSIEFEVINLGSEQ